MWRTKKMNLTEQYTQETGNKPVSYQLASKESDKRIQVVEVGYVQWLEAKLKEANAGALVDKIIEEGQKEPKYIPYESLEEIPDVFEKPIWLKHKDEGDHKIMFHNMEQLGWLYEHYTYLDGTPFGKKVEG